MCIVAEPRFPHCQVSPSRVPSDRPQFPHKMKGRPPMVFGMSLQTYTLIHVLISLIGIGSGWL